MRPLPRILTPALAATFALLAPGLDDSTAHAQMYYAQPPRTTYSYAPQTYYTPQYSYAPRTYVTRRPTFAPYHDPRAVLPAFSRRGGIGTTPFLGNIRGANQNSVNFDAPPRQYLGAQPVRRGFGRIFRRVR